MNILEAREQKGIEKGKAEEREFNRRSKRRMVMRMLEKGFAKEDIMELIELSNEELMALEKELLGEQ